MKIVINHLTRMSQGYICVAGVEPRSLKHIRPVLDSGRLKARLLTRNKGPFDMAVLVDLGRVEYVGEEPEVEDYRFQPGAAAAIRTVEPAKFWSLLQKMSKRRLSEIFGPALTSRGDDACASDSGEGDASLGCLIPENAPVLTLEPPLRPGKPARVRMALADPEFGRLDLSVTDIRLYESDHVTPDERRVERLAARLRRDSSAMLGVGLTRPYQGSELDPVHWLQVTNVHLPEVPVWQFG